MSQIDLEMSKPDPKTSNFEIISSNNVVGFPDGIIFSWCPSIDLLAMSMNKTSIWMFRANGERVYSINNRAEILDLRWNNSGKFFAISGVDHLIKIYDSNSGTLVNTFKTSSDLRITLCSWSSVDVICSISNTGPMSTLECQSFDDSFDVDILKGMPKLGLEIDTTDNSTSSVTNTNENEALLDFLLVINGHNQMSISFNNLLTVSDIPLSPNCTFLKHAMAQDLFNQYFLLQDSDSQLHLQNFRIPIEDPLRRKKFISTIKYSAQLVSMVNHIMEQLAFLTREANTFVSLYDRYLSNYVDSLYEGVDIMSNPPSPDQVEDAIIDSLSDILLTGLIPAKTKDFWLDQFGERALTKLSSVGNSAFDNCRKTLFTQIILALEMLIVLLSSLESIAVFEDHFKQESYGLALESLAKVTCSVKNLIKQTYDFIWLINDEQESFNKFLNWCKTEIIFKLASEGSDSESFFRAHPVMDFSVSLVMEYFSKYLLNSSFLQFLNLENQNLEVLRTTDNSFRLQQKFDHLQEELAPLLQSVQTFIRESYEFDELIPLHIKSSDPVCDIRLFGTTLVIAVVDANEILLRKMNNGTWVNMRIRFGTIVQSIQFISEDQILVLHQYQEEVHKVELIQILFSEGTVAYENLHVIKSMQFSKETFVNHPVLVSTSEREDQASKIGMVMDSSKKKYTVFRF